MHPYEFNISFRLTHPTEDLTQIYQKLSLVSDFLPRRIWKAGDERKSQQGKRLGGYYEKSYCYFDLNTGLQKSTSQSLTSVIENILTRLTPFKDVLEKFCGNAGQLEFFIGLYVVENAGETLPVTLLKKLSDFQIGLALDIYPPGKNE